MFRFHPMPFGAEFVEDGVRFALWAPTARDVDLLIGGKKHAMPDDGGGWRRLVLANAKAGTRYQFLIDGDHVVPDPASRFQPDDVQGPSAVVDPRSYKWREAAWTGRPWEEAVIYEIHVGTATPEGTYAALEERLPKLAALGITAIELMPLGDVPGGRNWGYDGVLPFAPESAYGTPDDLKRLIDQAHALGLMVLLDVVYNHFGPSGNYLHTYAECFFTERHKTPWGAAINCDGVHAATVRAFFIENALYWLDEFNFDGLRLDAVHAILDDSERHLLDELASRVRSAFPARHIHLVLENEANEARWLSRDDGAPRAYTAQWDDDIHNSWHALITGESEGYYEDFADAPVERLGRALAEGFSYQGEFARHLGRERGEPSAFLPPQAFVAFLQNHDQIGNRALGERLSHIVTEDRLELARAALLLSPQIPLLFMGEEWAASTPFQFFTGFADEELSAAVRDGRRREFEKFEAFSGHADRVPDPTLDATFLRSKLDWNERRRAPHAGVMSDVRTLLALRRREILPLLRSEYRGGSYDLPHAAALAVEWRFAAGNLRLLMNFGDDVVEALIDGSERLLWSSEWAVRQDPCVHLTRWTGAFVTSARPA
jgi:maltooligosyltrehalose trehalohydrolase